MGIRTIIDGTIEVDATISEKPTFSSTLTKNPVEEGADVTDHVKINPQVLTLECLFSNTPTSPLLAQTQGTTSPRQPGSAEFRLTLLRNLWTSKKPVTVETVRDTYENMMLTSIDPPVDAKTGDAVRATLRFEEIRFARNEAVRLQSAPQPKSKSEATKKDDKGKQAGVDDAGSIAHDLLGHPLVQSLKAGLQ